MISELGSEALSTAAPELRYVTGSLNILLCFVPILVHSRAFNEEFLVYYLEV